MTPKVVMDALPSTFFRLQLNTLRVFLLLHDNFTLFSFSLKYHF